MNACVFPLIGAANLSIRKDRKLAGMSTRRWRSHPAKNGKGQPRRLPNMASNMGVRLKSCTLDGKILILSKMFPRSEAPTNSLPVDPPERPREGGYFVFGVSFGKSNSSNLASTVSEFEVIMSHPRTSSTPTAPAKERVPRSWTEKDDGFGSNPT